MNKTLLILAAVMLTGCEYKYETKPLGLTKFVCVFRVQWGMADVPVSCGEWESGHIKKIQALADELNGLEK